jgi:hypothetical protein
MIDVERIRICSYTAFLSVITTRFDTQQWAFRGQSNADWDLSPSLERALQAKRELQKVSIIEEAEESDLLTQFKRRASHYLSDTPAEDDDLEWLALMQHHGAPTRLLDWTRSPYVGLFFAIEEAELGQPAALWAVHTGALERDAEDKLGKLGPAYYRQEPTDGKDFNRWFARVFLTRNSGLSTTEAPPNIVLPLAPLRMNARLTIQQGIFLSANGMRHQGFQRRVEAILRENREQRSREKIMFKLTIEGDRLRMLQELASMNINLSTLFPGIDGFARSLGTRTVLSPPLHQSIRPRYGL